MRETVSGAWSEDTWAQRERHTRVRALGARTEHAAWQEIRRHARAVLSTFSTSFFTVTRFLPAFKRAQVEVVYAAVRYPDEIVDTFPLTASERLERLHAWEQQYEQALSCTSLRRGIESGVPTILAGWASVVRRLGIPHEHYRAFLDAMRHDAVPGPFATLDDLIDRYIYGSAVVVGYFLAYIYGPGPGRTLDEALRTSRDLGIALQLTNFLRDVREDACRGRVYLPQDRLQAAGILRLDVDDPSQDAAVAVVLRALASHAEDLYAASARNLEVFDVDSRAAIRACIDVYRQLNTRIARTPEAFRRRAQVPFLDRYRVLPSSKYWRLPLAYLSR
jgi:15-cis-phytoene synthase